MQITNSERLFKMQSELCKVMTSPHRLMMLHELRQGEKTVNELSAATGLRQANVSQHLAVMRHRRVVVERHVGNSVLYRIADKRINDACDIIRALLFDQLSEDSQLVPRAATG